MLTLSISCIPLYCSLSVIYFDFVFFSFPVLILTTTCTQCQSRTETETETKFLLHFRKEKATLLKLL